MMRFLLLLQCASATARRWLISDQQFTARGGFAQKKVSGTLRRSKLPHLLRLESSRHLFFGQSPAEMRGELRRGGRVLMRSGADATDAACVIVSGLFILSSGKTVTL